MLKALSHGIYLFVLLFCLSLLLQAHASGAAAQNPEELIPAYDNLLSFTKNGSQTPLDADLVEVLLNFVASSKDLGDSLSLGKRQGDTSDYYEFTIDRPLKEILKLAFSKDIPSYTLAPSTLRLSYWIEANGKKQPLELNSDILDASSAPVVMRGLDFLENTPDTNSGAYYSYELDRAFIFTRHRGNRVLISTSEQRDRSSVGKKGLILGSDDDWNYLYTGEKGCTLAGLGWIRSYMYHSSAIIVYYETLDPYPQVKYAIFKWLRAGWSGFNLVKPHYLRRGVERYAKAFKEIIESPYLQDISEFSETFRKIKSLSTEELKRKAHRYFIELKNRHHEDNSLTMKWFIALFKDDLYLESLTRKELEAITNLEYLKYVLGKTSTFKPIGE
jgi:hypothetical protein